MDELNLICAVGRHFFLSRSFSSLLKFTCNVCRVRRWWLFVLVVLGVFAGTNNREKDVHLLHPAILVTGPQPGLGLVLEGCTFDFTENEQIFGVTFAGNIAYSDVCIRGNSFSAAGSNGGNFGARGVIFEGNGVVPDDGLSSLIESTSFHICNNQMNGAMILGPFHDAAEQDQLLECENFCGE